MGISEPLLLTLTLVFGTEYWLKQWWSNFCIGGRRPLVAYFCYRLFHMALLSGLGFLFFEFSDGRDWFLFSLLVVLIGSLEVLFAAFHRWFEELRGFRFHWLNFLLPLILTALCIIVNPSLIRIWGIDYRMVFLFVFLGQPANYFIRWVLAKEEITFTDNAAPVFWRTLQAFKSQPRNGTGAETDDAPGKPGLDLQTLQAGRMVGILERWLIIVLIASGNISGLGFVITAKSIVRYPKLSEPEFAEYYLVGTLLSVVLAASAGYLFLGVR